MLVAFIVVDVRVLVNLDPPGPIDSPSPNADEQETDQELRPTRPGFDIDEAPQRQPNPSDDHNTYAVTETPEDSGSCSTGRILNSCRGKCCEVIDTGEHMEAARGESGENRDHEGTVIGTGACRRWRRPALLPMEACRWWCRCVRACSSTGSGRLRGSRSSNGIDVGRRDRGDRAA